MKQVITEAPALIKEILDAGVKPVGVPSGLGLGTMDDNGALSVGDGGPAPHGVTEDPLAAAIVSEQERCAAVGLRSFPLLVTVQNCRGSEF